MIIIHFMNSKEINDLHRKAGTAVEMDMMPEENEMRDLINKAGMAVRFFLDDGMGYVLSASKRIIKIREGY